MIKQFTFLFALTGAFLTNAQSDYQYIPSQDNLDKGYEHLMKSEFPASVHYFEKIHRCDTNFHLAEFNTIIAHFAGENYDALNEVAVKAIQNESEYQTQMYYYYIESLLKQKNYSKAKEIIKEGKKAFPLYFQYDYQYAKVLIELGNTAEGVKILTEIINAHPQHSGSHFSLAKVKADAGYITEAILGFEMAALSNLNSTKLTESLVALESLMQDNYDFVKRHTDTGEFENLDQMIESQIALKDQYQPDVQSDYPFVKNTDLIFKQFSYDANSTSLSMTYYGKFLNEVKKKGLEKGYILYILQIVQRPEIQRLINANRNQVISFGNFLKEYFEEIQNQNKYAINGITYEGDYHNNESGLLVGTGMLKDDNKVGEWTFFYPNAQIKSVLNYNQQGELQGKSTWYDVYGNIIQYGTYKEGIIDGEASFSRDNNCKWYTGKFNDNKWNGNAKIYNERGILIEEKNFVEGKLEGDWKEFSTSGTVIGIATYKNDLLEGKYKSFYDNGNIYLEGDFEKGKWNGAYKKFHINGKVQTEGNYKNGKQIGHWIEYDYNGVKSAEYDYDNSGEAKGMYIQYRKGDTLSKAPYKGGKTNGVEYDYGIGTNDVLWKHTYKKGKLKSYVCYGKDGKILAEGKKKYVLYDGFGYKYIQSSIKKGKFHGEHLVYWKSGKVKKRKVFVKGELTGEVTAYYESGALNYKGFYKEGYFHGKYESRYANGNLYAEGYYVEGDQTGEWRFYHPNGKLSEIKFFINDVLHGIKEEFDINGVKIYETKYDDGVIVRTDVFSEDGSLYKRIKTPQGNGEYNLYHPTGFVRIKGQLNAGTQDGKITFHYPNGKVLEERNKLNGVYHGDFKMYHVNGKVEVEGKYEYGKRVGKWVNYFASGKKSRERTYEYGEVRDSAIWYFENGNKNKVYHYDYNGDVVKEVFYHRNGVISSITPKLGDLVHGVLFNYDDKGELMAARKYNGGLVVAYSYMKDGKLLPFIDFNGTGTMETFYNNGNKGAVFTQKNSMYEGPYQRYYSNGQIFIDANYSDDKADGKYIVYSPTGTKYSESEYKDGRSHGTLKHFNDIGKIQSERTYVQGVLDGVTKYYNQQGKLIYTLTYNDDVVIEIK